MPKPEVAKLRVLVVEDEVKMAGLLRRGLQEEGYAVDTDRGHGCGLRQGDQDSPGTAGPRFGNLSQT